MTPEANVYLFDAMLRMEKKMDELLRQVAMDPEKPGFQPLSSKGQVCPLCNNPIVYFELLPGVTGRDCKCKPHTED